MLPNESDQRRSHTLRKLASTVLAFAMASTASAGPVNRSHLPRDIGWYMHLDLEAFVHSDLGRVVRESNESLVLDGSEFVGMLQLEAGAEIRSLTCFGFRDPSDAASAVLLADLTASFDDAMSRLRSDPRLNAAEVMAGPYPATRFTPEDPEAWEVERVYVSMIELPNGRRAVMSSDPGLVQQARDVLENRGPSLDEESPLSGLEPQLGSYFFSAGAEMGDVADTRLLPRLAQLSESGMLDIGERDGATYVRGRISGKDESCARDIADILQGGIALVRIMTSDVEDLAPMLDALLALRLQADGRMIEFQTEFELGRMLEQLSMAGDED